VKRGTRFAERTDSAGTEVWRRLKVAGSSSDWVTGNFYLVKQQSSTDCSPAEDAAGRLEKETRKLGWQNAYFTSCSIRRDRFSTFGLGKMPA